MARKADAMEERGSADMKTIAEQWGHKIYPGNKNEVRVNPLNVDVRWPETDSHLATRPDESREPPTNSLSSDCCLWHD